MQSCRHAVLHVKFMNPVAYFFLPSLYFGASLKLATMYFLNSGSPFPLKVSRYNKSIIITFLCLE